MGNKHIIGTAPRRLHPYDNRHTAGAGILAVGSCSVERSWRLATLVQLDGRYKLVLYREKSCFN